MVLDIEMVTAGPIAVQVVPLDEEKAAKLDPVRVRRTQPAGTALPDNVRAVVPPVLVRFWKR
jgi:hypothetical protein